MNCPGRIHASVITIGRCEAFLYRFLHPPTDFLISSYLRGFTKGTDKFPMQKCAIFRKFKEISGIARRQTVLMPHKRFR